MIWFTADTHYGHKNICRGVSDWVDLDSTRDFKTISEMNEAIINNINSTVGPSDELYHLGDWSFGGLFNILNFREKIKCDKIHIVPGNHDHHIINNKNLEYRWIREFNGPIDQWLEYCDDFKTEEECLKACDSFYIPYKYEYKNTYDLFTRVLPQCYNLKYGNKSIILSHYPIESWEGKGQKSIHLHGHCHHALDNSELNISGRRMDVGMDWEEFRPFSIDEILETILKRNGIKHKQSNSFEGH